MGEAGKGVSGRNAVVQNARTRRAEGLADLLGGETWTQLIEPNAANRELDVDGNIPYQPVLCSVNGRVALRLHQEEPAVGWEVCVGSIRP